MSNRSQADLEDQLRRRWAQVERKALSRQQAFGTLEEWVIQLGQRRAFLNPVLKQWLWYDRLHDEWAFAGCGAGEAILLTVGKLGGIKKLPRSTDVDAWCVYWQAQELRGPLPIADLLKKVQSQQVPMNILVWSPRAANWLTVGYDQADKEVYLRSSFKFAQYIGIRPLPHWRGSGPTGRICTNALGRANHYLG